MSGREDGFTLIELIVTMVVTSLIVLAITSLFITIEGTQRSSDLLEAATRAGQQEIESLRNDNYTSLPPDTSIDFTDKLPSVLPGPRTGTTAITEPVPGIKRVDVTITYKDGSQIRDVRLSSLIGQLGIGQ